MSKNVTTIGPETSLKDAADLMGRMGIGMLPIVAQGELPLGVITDRDIALRAFGNGLPASTKVSEAMSHGVQMVFEDRELDYALSEMARLKVRRLLVCDHALQLVGVLSLADVVAAPEPEAGISKVSRALRRRTRAARVSDRQTARSTPEVHFTNGAGVWIGVGSGRPIDRRN